MVPVGVRMEGVVEVAVACTLHDGLGARPGKTPVVSLTEGPIALAGQPVADLGKPHLAIHFGIPAARDMVAVARVALLHYLDREGAAARPSLLPVDEGLHRGIAADRRRHLACLLDRRAAH